MPETALDAYCNILKRKKISDKFETCKIDTIETVKLMHRDNPNCVRKEFADVSRKYAGVTPSLSRQVALEVLGKPKNVPNPDGSIPPNEILTLYHGTMDPNVFACGLDAEIPQTRSFPGDWELGNGLFVTPEPIVARRFGWYIYEIKVPAKYLIAPYGLGLNPGGHENRSKVTLKESLELMGEPQALLVQSLPPGFAKPYEHWEQKRHAETLGDGEWVRDA